MTEGASVLPDLEGFGAAISFGNHVTPPPNGDFAILPDYMDFVSEGDVLSLSDQGHVWVVFRKSSNYNTFLLTEQCNHLCLMCSQPPKKIDDSWLLKQAIDVIDFIPKATFRMGYSGGEPTIYGDGLVDLIEKCAGMLPNTMIDILTNGRAFADPIYAKKIAEVNHKNCLICIPVYSSEPEIHDYVVQSAGAFDETIDGILNLKALKQKVELRIVLHKQTIETLVETCHFISKSLRFVDHVALMGLEITGFTRANLEDLWIDPHDYKDELSKAIYILNASNIRASVYNHQLCTVNPDILSNYVHSISDWKNEYLDKCEGCLKKAQCGGFFSSSILYRHSSKIVPFTQI
ncbi:His-Xaa-Ser system radical SAM maturase HxsC [Alphaproteobacteria bacterium]|nr:His-Xaa-Ser system radical SAM maturase HxsC [Alphaproteobacteria bacterium]